MSFWLALSFFTIDGNYVQRERETYKYISPDMVSIIIFIINAMWNKKKRI